MATPSTEFAKSGDVHIAYQVLGEGPFDLVLVPGAVSHLEMGWEDPEIGRFYRGLASFSRLILFDKRGTGLSDRVPVASLEERMDDVRAVMEAVGSTESALLGVSDGAPMSVLFAATYPQRTRALVLFGGFAQFMRLDPETRESYLRFVGDAWARGDLTDLLVPRSAAADPARRDWWRRFQRAAASPSAFETLNRMNFDIDVRSVLPSVAVPTLVLHRRDDPAAPFAAGKELAEGIPGAHLVVLAGEDHVPWTGDVHGVLGAIEEFLTGTRRSGEVDRVLTTLVFTDIVESTQTVEKLGDRRWRDLLDRHDSEIRRQLASFRGREVNTTGDGFLAAFDGPGRAIRFGKAVVDALLPIGVQIRVGVHTGECEVRGADLGGIAVHVAARVASVAGPGEILVSSTVRDLVAGSGLEFEPRGTHRLKGTTADRQLYAVAAEHPPPS